MFLSNASVRRPVAMCAFIIALTLLGLNAYRKMGLEYIPKVDLPYVTVITVYPGASPNEIEPDVAKRIEDAVVSVDALKHVTSSCMENVCQTLLEFQLGVDVDVAASDVREKLDLIANDLPADAEKPKVLKFDVNAKPIISLALSGDQSVDELFDYADNTLRDRISVISGVADVQVLGGSKREVQVLIGREKLAARGLMTTDIVRALTQGIGKIPAGRVRDSGTEYSVKFNAEYDDLADIGLLEVAGENGSRCYLSNLGTVRMGSEERRQVSFIEGHHAVAIRVVKKADANAVRVVESVRKAFGDIQSTLPGGMKLDWISDDGTFIRATVNSTRSSIVQGILLTAVILFLFLYNVRSTMVVAITMPLTIVISLFVLHALGYSLNVSTMLAIGLSVGILVTNSIVVMENIVKLVASGQEPHDAARQGTGEVVVAVLASAATNIVVLFPIAMMGSRVGLFFKPFAWSMLVVTVASLFISFTLTPILAARFLKPAGSGRGSLLARIEQRWNALFDAFARGYGAFLRFMAKRRWAAILLLVGSIALLVQSLRLMSKIGFTFMRESDQGQMYVKLEYPTNYSLDRTAERVHGVEATLASLPGLHHTLTTIGKVEGVIGQSSEGVYLAQILLTFPDKMELRETIDDLVKEVRRRLTGYPDCIISVNSASGVGGQNKQIELEIAGEDLRELDRLAKRVSDLALDVPGATDVDNSVRIGKTEIQVTPDRAVLADLRMPATGLGMALRGNMEGLKAAVFKRGARTYDIRVKFAEKEGKQQVEGYLFPGEAGRPVSLTNFASLKESPSPVQITRNDKRRVSKVYANLDRGAALGTVVTSMTRAINENAGLTAGYQYRFVGMFEVMQEGVMEFLEAGLLAVLLTYLTLAAILESFKQPLIILVTIPLGLIGILWALFLGGESLSIFALLGSVMLVGVVVNNAILIMDQVNQFKAKGSSPRDAMVHAAVEELRPIVMITFAALLGMLPLAIGSGLGSESRTGIGIASIGGIAVSALLTLVVLPVLYDLFTKEMKNEE